MELEATNNLFIHKAAWASLPPRYQAILKYACWYALTEMLASYDAKNAKAIARVVAGGAQLSVLPPEIVKALRTALETVLDEEGRQERAVQEDPGELAPVPRRTASLVCDCRYAGGTGDLYRVAGRTHSAKPTRLGARISSASRPLRTMRTMSWRATPMSLSMWSLSAASSAMARLMRRRSA